MGEVAGSLQRVRRGVDQQRQQPRIGHPRRIFQEGVQEEEGTRCHPRGGPAVRDEAAVRPRFFS